MPCTNSLCSGLSVSPMIRLLFEVANQYHGIPRQSPHHHQHIALQHPSMLCPLYIITSSHHIIKTKDMIQTPYKWLLPPIYVDDTNVCHDKNPTGIEFLGCG